MQRTTRLEDDIYGKAQRSGTPARVNSDSWQDENQSQTIVPGILLSVKCSLSLFQFSMRTWVIQKLCPTETSSDLHKHPCSSTLSCTGLKVREVGTQNIV